MPTSGLINQGYLEAQQPGVLDCTTPLFDMSEIPHPLFHSTIALTIRDLNH